MIYMFNIMIEYGHRFDKPIIKGVAMPGSWIEIDGRSTFVTMGIEHTLNHIIKNYPDIFGDDLYVDLIFSASQIVFGVNIYLEFQVICFNKIYIINSLVHDPEPGVRSSDKKIVVKNIYVKEII